MFEANTVVDLADDVPWYIVFLVGIGIGAGIVYFLPRLSASARAPELANTNTMKVTAANAEEWQWTDYKGHERRLMVTREVKE